MSKNCPLTCVNLFCQYVHVECTKVDVMFVTVTRNSGDLNRLEISPIPHMFYSHMKQISSKEIYIRVKQS